MSLYKSTNEMFNNSSLCHSDTYLGNDYTDGIKHYKYVRKEPNGKGGYKYYYKELNLDGTPREWYTKNKKGYYGTYKSYNGTEYEQDKHGNYKPIGHDTKTIHIKKSNKLFSSSKTKKYANNSYGHEYVTTKNVGLIEQNVRKGKNKVDKLLKKFGKKLRKIIPRSIID